MSTPPVPNSLRSALRAVLSILGAVALLAALKLILFPALSWWWVTLPIWGVWLACLVMCLWLAVRTLFSSSRA